EISSEITRLSRKFGEQPRLHEMSRRQGLPNAVIAAWGSVSLEVLDEPTLQILASGKSPGAGLLIDYLGDFQRSAQLCEPVYRIAGGAGYLWAASYDAEGRGTLRFAAVDMSAAT